MSKHNLALKPLVPKPVTPKPTPTFFSQNQRPISNFEMEIDPTLLVDAYHDVNNYHKESIRVDDNFLDMTVSKNDIFIFNLCHVKL
jgi:hypothetical protein